MRGSPEPSEQPGQVLKHRHCTQMYGPPPNCKRLEVGEKAVRVNVSGLLVEKSLSGRLMMIRTCRSYKIPRSPGTHLSAQVFRHAVGLLFRLLLFSADLWNPLSPSSWRWKRGKRSVLSKRSVFSTAIKLPLPAAADVDNPGRWTARPRRCELVCWRWRQSLCCGELAESAGAPTVPILRCRT
jgi:hypothetical protein